MLDFIFVDEGRIVFDRNVLFYEYSIKDHLGDVRVCFADRGNGTPTVTQERGYYPFGLSMFGLEFDSLKLAVTPKYIFNENRFNGKEFQEFMCLQWYDYGARFYDQQIGRWLSIDPLAEKSRRWSPYVYGINNPIRFIDPDGRSPGDIFKTPVEAAHDFGLCYNGKSIIENREYGSSIYIITDKNNKLIGFSYTVPTRGSEGEVVVSPSPDGTKTIADVHSHATYTGYGSDDFSKQDKKNDIKNNIEGFLTTPSGYLKQYNLPFGNKKLGKTSDISTDLPSDSKDPNRVNKIEPSKEQSIDPSQSSFTTLYEKLMKVVEEFLKK
jgi:RHS repeat-associated protein